MNIGFEPSIAVSRKFGKLGFNVFAGYQVAVFHGKVKPRGYTKAYLVNPNNNERVHANWDGFRFGGGLSYFID